MTRIGESKVVRTYDVENHKGGAILPHPQTRCSVYGFATTAEGRKTLSLSLSSLSRRGAG